MSEKPWVAGGWRSLDVNGDANVGPAKTVNLIAACRRPEQVSVGRQPGHGCDLPTASWLAAPGLPGCTRARCFSTSVVARPALVMFAALPIHDCPENDHTQDPGNEHGAHYIRGDPAACHVHASPHSACQPIRREPGCSGSVKGMRWIGCTMISSSSPMRLSAGPRCSQKLP